MDISKTCTDDHHHMDDDDDDECSCSTKEVVVAEDLILEILFRLPLISVFRFKFVCKSWYSLISNPDFLKKIHHHPQRLLDHSDILLISIVEDKHNPEFVILPPQNQIQDQEQLKVFLDHALSVFIPQNFSSSSRLIDSCNGLLLYRNENPISGETQYHVLNPITKQCFKLPINERFRNNSIYWLHIVFDPSVSLSFKVVMCFGCRNMNDFGLCVYSSETSSLKYFKYITRCLPWDDLFHCHWRAVLLDGMLYLCTNQDKLVCFEVVEDSIRLLPLPLRAMKHHKRNLLYFGECGGRLRLIERYSSNNCYDHQLVTSPFSFDIMELEDCHDHPLKIRNWTVKYRVKIEVSYEDHIPLAAQIIHIYKTGAEEDEALLFLNVGRNTIISYNLTSNTFGKEQKIPNFDHSHGLHSFPYSPTLFPFSSLS